ncbi:hypothetical protein [Acinetobacter baumannii]|uniref:hypothetical protein n=1 Tax=Acinetobacter baumannii TaxID=470 RepID=UPI000DE6BF80|nr:hypothetical protein [Acinetobacter baumannii]MCZ3144657.1 hypothetical protein [Acinetobacter baumannii]MCZ3162872.1 hypothetical protein [Acinetobacter baumannii]SSV09023.1 Uncharacterised protein [Acinetobacter baumannii]
MVTQLMALVLLFFKSISYPRFGLNKLYSERYQLLSDIIQNKNYAELLAIYNRKSLASQISPSLGLTNGSLPETVVRLSKSDCGNEIRAALKPYFGNFQQLIN